MSQENPMTPGQLYSEPPAPQKSHWKLIVGLIVGLFVLIISVIGGIFFLIFSMIGGSDVAKEALAKARANPAVVEQLGTPVKQGWFVSGSISINGGSGSADLSVPISGPKGKGTLYVTASKSAGTWTYSVLQVAIEGRSERIDLLGPSNITWVPLSELSFVGG